MAIGYLVSAGPIDFYGWSIEPRGWVGTITPPLFVHDWALPMLFYAMALLHIGAVLKRHFAQGGTAAVRRMLRCDATGV